MDVAEKAYIAGIIDGEGTISLQRSHSYKHYCPIISVANNDLQLLKWLREKVGTGPICTRRTKKLPHHNTSYRWDLRSNKALDLLKEIKEYLIIKRPHAELLLADYKKLTPRNGRYTAGQLKAKNELVAKIRKLNHRPQQI